VQGTPEPDLRRTLGRGELVALVYRLGQAAASGVLTLAPRGARPEVLVLRRGAAVCGDGEPARRALVARLARAAGEPSIAAMFDGGVTAYPPGAVHQVALAGWARTHLEAQLDGALAEVLVRELAGIPLSLRAELAPSPVDDADRRMLAAMAQPRRLDQIWPLARTPRFRLLAFLHFLRGVGALAGVGVAAERSAPAAGLDPRRSAARRLLGVDDIADEGAVKRAYRRLARALHPDLQPDADEPRRRVLERRFAEVTAAYEALARDALAGTALE
jgi:DnaJ-domain-containing protein 1